MVVLAARFLFCRFSQPRRVPWLSDFARGSEELTMYVAIRLYDGVKSPDEAAAKVRNEFVPVISKIPGFQQYYVVKTGDATIASVSVFKDKPGADESVQAAKKWVQQNLSQFLPNPPQVISGETVAHAAA
jgi:hypothetical protein